MLQNKIHDIILSPGEKGEKIVLLKSLFAIEKGILFSDLDDTITTQDSLLYARLYILSHFFSSFGDVREMAKLLEPYIKVNPKFLSLMANKKQKKIIILSRNDFPFLEILLPKLNEHLSSAGLEIVGVVGRSREHGFYFTTIDKISILPPESELVSDMFEESILGHYPLFTSVDTSSIPGSKLAFTLIKYIRIIPFFLGLCIFGKKFFHS